MNAGEYAVAVVTARGAAWRARPQRRLRRAAGRRRGRRRGVRASRQAARADAAGGGPRRITECCAERPVARRGAGRRRAARVRHRRGAASRAPGQSGAQRRVRAARARAQGTRRAPARRLRAPRATAAPAAAARPRRAAAASRRRRRRAGGRAASAGRAAAARHRGARGGRGPRCGAVHARSPAGVEPASATIRCACAGLIAGAVRAAHEPRGERDQRPCGAPAPCGRRAAPCWPTSEERVQGGLADRQRGGDARQRALPPGQRRGDGERPRGIPRASAHSGTVAQEASACPAADSATQTAVNTAARSSRRPASGARRRVGGRHGGAIISPGPPPSTAGPQGAVRPRPVEARCRTRVAAYTGRTRPRIRRMSGITSTRAYAQVVAAIRNGMSSRSQEAGA